jgi:hypothetical protein
MPRPELAIAGAQIVIGLGRSVLEAMAAGRAAFVYGVVGGDGWVTPEQYPAMEADGFGGTATRGRVFDADALADELRGWEAGMGEVNRDLVSAHHSAREHAIELVELACRLAPSRPAAAAPPGEEVARLLRLQWHSEMAASSALAELERTAAALADERAELDTVRSSRRWRLATMIASPLDRLRRL